MQVPTKRQLRRSLARILVHARMRRQGMGNRMRDSNTLGGEQDEEDRIAWGRVCDWAAEALGQPNEKQLEHALSGGEES